MKVLITGATGLVGKELTELLLQNGIKINYLTTSKSKIQSQPNYQGFYWNPQSGVIDENCLMGVTAIVHLAGASIAKRWTDSYKQQIIESRFLSTNLLYNALKNYTHQVTSIISASAIGIYPSSLDAFYKEDFEDFEETFLSKVVVRWEESLLQIERLGITVCKLRIGLVLSQNGGVLQQVLKATRLGLGAAFGNGKQCMSWIHIHDLANMFLFAIHNNLQGVYNAVAPNPVSNQEFSLTVAQTLHKPFFLPNVPRFVMAIFLGEMHLLLFESQNVSAEKIISQGFRFEFKTLFTALQDLLVEK
jgi:uncharacterized protein